MMMSAKTLERTSSTSLRESHGALFVRFCREMVVHGEGDMFGQPFILRPDQQLWAWQWFEYQRDELGDEHWWFERCYYEAPKGDGKTMLLAALAQSNGVQTRAAAVLKISYRSFRHLAKKYEL